ncbi:ead/Ea22-like family protein [Klebsiella oxytoca]
MTDITELAQSHELRNKVNHRLYGALEFQGTSGENATITLSIDECKSIIAAMDERITLVEALEKAQTDCNDYASSERAVAVKSVELQDEIYGLKARIAELESRTVKLPPELYTIGELIRTQDNRITDQPMFVVFQKREIIGSDEHSPSRICWVWDGEEVSELRARRLEALYQDGRDTRGYDRYAMQEVDEFVTACFTEHGCKDYLRQNGHNLRLPYIYACGSFRNNEYQLVRNWLAGVNVEFE